jgi:hypothetical protein
LFFSDRGLEFALAIVGEAEEAKVRPVLLPGEVEPWNVAVRIAGSKELSAPGAAADANRLLSAIVEILGLSLVCDRAAIIRSRGILEAAG